MPVLCQAAITLRQLTVTLSLLRITLDARLFCQSSVTRSIRGHFGFWPRICDLVIPFRPLCFWIVRVGITYYQLPVRGPLVVGVVETEVPPRDGDCYFYGGPFGNSFLHVHFSISTAAGISILFAITKNTQILSISTLLSSQYIYVL